MRLEIYAARDTAIHRLHPATKLVLLVVALVAPFLSDDPAAQAGPLVAALAVAAAGRVLREALGPWKLLLFIFAATFLLWGFVGEAVPRPGESLEAAVHAKRMKALGYGLRVSAIFLLGLVYLATTRVEETIRALEDLRVPFRLAFTLGLTFRLVPLFLASAATIVEAQRARGLDLSKGRLLERLRKYVPVLVPVFMTSLRNADLMALALEARGFSEPGPRTRLKEDRLGAADLVAAACGAGYVAFFWALRSGTFSAVPG